METQAQVVPEVTDDGPPLRVHPVAALFPMMTDDELDDLATDIKANGLLHPIVLDADGVLIDGRNRLKACRRGNINPKFTTLQVPDATAYIVASNLKRRHLSEAQRAMIAASLANLLGPGRPPVIGTTVPITQSDAAALLGVSRKSVNRAAKVQAQGVPGLAAAVETGTMAVSVAAVVADLPEEEQQEVLGKVLEAVAGKTVTQKQVDKIVRVLHDATTNIHVSDGSDEWYTPEEHIEAARAMMGSIDLDPASHAAAQEVIQAGTYFGKEEDGLNRDWFGNVWLNPPFSAKLVAEFTAKLVAEYEAGRVKAGVVLVNNATDTLWFQPLLKRFPACFTCGRVKFWKPYAKDLAARQGQTLFAVGVDVARFADAFGQFGTITTPYD